MNVLIVFDSFFGNTEKIARAIGNSFGEAHNVKIVRVQDFTADLLSGTNLLIAGSPTRAFRPSEGTQKFLEELPAKSLAGMKFAAFYLGLRPGGTVVLTGVLCLTAMLALGGRRVKKRSRAGHAA
jgi:flavodoxin